MNNLNKEELNQLNIEDKIKFLYYDKNFNLQKEEFFVIKRKLVLPTNFVQYELTEMGTGSAKSITINDLVRKDGLQNLKNNLFRYIVKL